MLRPVTLLAVASVALLVQTISWAIEPLQLPEPDPALANNPTVVDEVARPPAEFLSLPESNAAAVGAPVLDGQFVSCPMVRDVRLNLSIDDLKTDSLIQLKRKRTGVFAEALKALPEKLEFEVVVIWPCGEIPVYFPVPESSPVCKAYHEHKDSDPSKILAAMCRVRRPVVRVVGVRTARPFEVYEGGCLTQCKATCYFKPFYEVHLPDAVCSEPVLVPIPSEDCVLHEAVKRAGNNLLGCQDVVVVGQLSGGDTSCVQCCPQCQQGRPCGQPHEPHSS